MHPKNRHFAGMAVKGDELSVCFYRSAIFANKKMIK